jgi:hypothetical protein
MMLLLSSLTLFLGSRRNDDDPQFGDRTASAEFPRTEFPSGQLTSSAWEGWWHDDAQAP